MAIQKTDAVWIPPPLPAPPPEPVAARSNNAVKEDSDDNGSFELFGRDGFSFDDLIDVINPLQHIPVVSAIYRSVTGDEIAAGPRIAGGALFGGPIGAAVATLNASIEEGTGKDLGGHVMALFERTGPSSPSPDSGEVMVASAEDGFPDAAFVTAAGGPSPVPELSALAPLPSAVPESPATVPQQPIELAALAPLPAAMAAPEILASVRSTLQAARVAQNQIAAVGEVPVQSAATDDEPESAAPSTPPPGAMASEGGWFTEVMLAALEQFEATGKYDAAARLTGGDAAATGPVLQR